MVLIFEYTSQRSVDYGVHNLRRKRNFFCYELFVLKGDSEVEQAFSQCSQKFKIDKKRLACVDLWCHKPFYSQSVTFSVRFELKNIV